MRKVNIDKRKKKRRTREADITRRNKNFKKTVQFGEKEKDDAKKLTR